MERSEAVSPKQMQLIALLLTERTIEAACAKAKVSVTTYWRWMQDSDFLGEYRSARDSILENTVAKLQSLSFEAVDALQRNLNCGSPSAEIRCATIILEQTLKGVELLSLKGRIEELESVISEHGENDE